MGDILYNAAQTFQKINEYDYNFILGNSHRQITITCASTEKGEFTHIIGLDHLTDIPVVTASTLWQKEAIYKNILKEKICYEDISESMYLNSETNPEQLYDIKKRIEMFQYADIVLEEAYKGKFLRWNANRSNILLPDGMKIRSTIRADYLLAVPLEDTKDEKMYFFMYQTNKQSSKMNPIKLHIFSVFSDKIDFTYGQDKSYTILETSKYHIKSRTLTTIYTRPSYAKSKCPE